MQAITHISYSDDSLHDKAQQLAQQLLMELDKTAEPCLLLMPDKLTLKMPGFSPLSAELSASYWAKRKSEGKTQGVVKACKPAPGLKIIDATAGWGRDAAILASFGAEVTMLERQPVMVALLEDALSRCSVSDTKAMKLSLHAGNACSYLSALEPSEYPDVIYIDPMHPERQKSALVKKDMQALQNIIGVDNDALTLIELALQRARQKVVVKWPQKKQALLPAHNCIPGKTVRFDIYTPICLL